MFLRRCHCEQGDSHYIVQRICTELVCQHPTLHEEAYSLREPIGSNERLWDSVLKPLETSQLQQVNYSRTHEISISRLASPQHLQLPKCPPGLMPMSGPEGLPQHTDQCPNATRGAAATRRSMPKRYQRSCRNTPINAQTLPEELPQHADQCPNASTDVPIMTHNDTWPNVAFHFKLQSCTREDYAPAHCRLWTDTWNKYLQTHAMLCDLPTCRCVSLVWNTGCSCVQAMQGTIGSRKMLGRCMSDAILST
jgi:hypothetical protein